MKKFIALALLFLNSSFLCTHVYASSLNAYTNGYARVDKDMEVDPFILDQALLDFIQQLPRNEKLHPALATLRKHIN